MRKRRRGIIIFVVVVLLAGGWYWFRVRKGKEDEGPPVDIVTVDRGKVARTVTADGLLRPLTTVEVKSYAGGSVDVLAVDVGDHVRTGDLIAKIDPTDSRTAYEQAMADLTSAQAGKTQAVEQRDVQDDLTAASITQAEANYQAALEDLARLEGATQPQARADAKAALDRAEAGVIANQRDLDGLKLATHPQSAAEARAALDQATATLEAAQRDVARLTDASLPQAKAEARSAVDRAQALVEARSQDLQRLQSAGHPGARAQAGSELAKARSSLTAARRELERAKGLKAEDLIPQSELDEAIRAFEAAQADFDYADERVATLAADQTGEKRSTEMNVAQAQADLSSAEEKWRTLEAQQAAELRVAQIDVTVSQADLSAAQQRWATLEAEQTTEVQAAEARMRQSEADLAAARERWNTLEDDLAAELRAAQARARQARAGLDSAQAEAVEMRLREAALLSAQAQVARAEAQVDNAQTMLGYTTVMAPRDGVILQRFVEEGTIITSGRSSVTTGTTIVELGDVSRMFVDVQIDESDLGLIKLDQRVVISVEAYRGDKFEGKVTGIDPQALTEATITTVLVEVEVLDKDLRLIPGLTAACDFIGDSVDDVLRLPPRAVRRSDQGRVVRVIVDGETVERSVTTGLEGDEYIEIKEGVVEGEEVMVPRLGSQEEERENRGREMGRRMGGGGFSKN